MKRVRFLLLVCTASLSITGFAQEKKKETTLTPPASMMDAGIDAPAPVPQMPTAKNEEVFVHVEQMPSFPGGSDKMFAFIQKNKKYPQKGPDQDKEGKVFVAFVVKSDGSIQDIQVKRSLSPSHDAEAIRVVKMMPKWIPAMQNGKAVNCWFTLPIDFYFLK